MRSKVSLFSKYLTFIPFLLLFYNVTFSQTIDPILNSLYNKKILMVNKLLNKTLQNGANEYSQLPQRFAKEFGIDLSKTDPVVRVLMRYEGNIELLKKNKIKVESKIDNIFVVTFEIS